MRFKGKCKTFTPNAKRNAKRRKQPAQIIRHKKSGVSTPPQFSAPQALKHIPLYWSAIKINCAAGILRVPAFSLQKGVFI